MRHETQKSEIADDLQPKIMPKLQDAIKNAQCDLVLFIQQLHIDCIQLTEANKNVTRRNLIVSSK